MTAVISMQNVPAGAVLTGSTADVPGNANDRVGSESDMEIDELEPTPPPSTSLEGLLTGLASTTIMEDDSAMRGIRRKFAETELSGLHDRDKERELAAKNFPKLRHVLSQLYQALEPSASQVAIAGCAMQLKVPALSVANWLAWRTTLYSSGLPTAKRRRLTPISSGGPAEISSMHATASHPSSTSGASVQGAVSQPSRPRAPEASRPGSLSISSNMQDRDLIAAPGREVHLPRTNAESPRTLPGQGAIPPAHAQSGIAPSRRESLVSPTTSVTSGAALFPSPQSSPVTVHPRFHPYDEGRRTFNSTRAPTAGLPGAWNVPQQQATCSRALDNVEKRRQTLTPVKVPSVQPTGLPQPQEHTPAHDAPLQTPFPAYIPAGSTQSQHSPIAGQPGHSNVALQRPPAPPAIPPRGHRQPASRMAFHAPAQAAAPPSAQPLNDQAVADTDRRQQQQNLAENVHGWQPPQPLYQPTTRQNARPHPTPPPPQQQLMRLSGQGQCVQQPPSQQLSPNCWDGAGQPGAMYTPNLHGRNLQQMATFRAHQMQQNQNIQPGQYAPPARRTATRISVPTQPWPGQTLVADDGFLLPEPISHHSQQPHDVVHPQPVQEQAPGFVTRLPGTCQASSCHAPGEYQPPQPGTPAHYQEMYHESRRLLAQHGTANGHRSHANQEPPPADQPPPLGSSFQPNYQWQQQPVSHAPTAPGQSTHAGQRFRQRPQGPSTHPSEQPAPGPSTHANHRYPPPGHSNQQLQLERREGQQYDTPGQQAPHHVAPGLRFSESMAPGPLHTGHVAPGQFTGMRPPSAPRPSSQPQQGQPTHTPSWTQRPPSQPYNGQLASPNANSYAQSYQPESRTQPFPSQHARSYGPPARPPSVPSQSFPPSGTPPGLANAFAETGSPHAAQPPPPLDLRVPSSPQQATRPVTRPLDVTRVAPAPPARRRSSHPSQDMLPVDRIAGPALAERQHHLAHSQAAHLAQGASACSPPQSIFQAALAPAPQPSSSTDRPVTYAQVSAPPQSAAQLSPSAGPGPDQAPPATSSPHVCWITHTFDYKCPYKAQFRPISDAEHEQLTTEDFANYASWAHLFWQAVQDQFTLMGDAEKAQQALMARNLERARTRARRQREQRSTAAGSSGAQQSAGAGPFRSMLPTPSPANCFDELPSPPRTATSPLPAVDESPTAVPTLRTPQEPDKTLFDFFDLCARGPLDASVELPAIPELHNVSDTAAAKWLMPYTDAWKKLRNPDSAMLQQVLVNMLQRLRRSGAYPYQRVRPVLRLSTFTSAPALAEASIADVEMAHEPSPAPTVGDTSTAVQKVEEQEYDIMAGTATMVTPDPTPEPHRRLEAPPPPPPPPAPPAAGTSADWRQGIFAKIKAMRETGNSG
ncbi:hypothetical protein AURDEDRAFT_153154 [Auricularia subglabra TFB-10046 SS5]|nr:hypothetical protein AURDEDRAFT_153154 [Auricularia subglabra TFB-10046 SS5]